MKDLVADDDDVVVTLDDRDAHPDLALETRLVLRERVCDDGEAQRGVGVADYTERRAAKDLECRRHVACRWR